jgi:glycosyltransferase domain-containing protein
MNLSGKLTIVILSRNRQHYLLRQVGFWRNKNIDVVILDQSPSALAIPQPELVSNIRYFHKDMAFTERLIYAVGRVNTPYAIFLPDDEFHLESCLAKCVQFLDENPDYATCAGRSLAFQVDSEVCGYPIYENLADFRIANGHPYERVMNLAYPYRFQPIHAVSRIEVWQLAGKTFANGVQTPPDMFELVFGFAAAYCGKLVVIPELMNLRSRENAPVNTADWQQDKRTPVWLSDQDHIGERVRFFENVSATQPTSATEPLRYDIAVSLGLLHYIAGSKSTARTRPAGKSFLLNGQALKNALPRPVFYWAKKLKHGLFVLAGKKSIPRENLLGLAKRMKEEGRMGVDQESVAEINECIRNFHGL